MSEADVLEQLNQTADRILLVWQWWLSISIGLVAVAHFANEKLNKGLVVTLIVLYVCFTAWNATYIANIGAQNTSYVETLEQIELSGELSPAGQYWVNETPLPQSPLEWVGAILSGIGPIAAFFGAIGYVLYSYRKSQPREQ